MEQQIQQWLKLLASNYFNHPPLARDQVQQERTEVTEIDVVASFVE